MKLYNDAHLGGAGALGAVHEREDRLPEHVRRQVLGQNVGNLSTCQSE